LEFINREEIGRNLKKTGDLEGRVWLAENRKQQDKHKIDGDYMQKNVHIRRATVSLSIAAISSEIGLT